MRQLSSLQEFRIPNDQETSQRKGRFKEDHRAAHQETAQTYLQDYSRSTLLSFSQFDQHHKAPKSN
jgi:hypothetical protein